MSATFVFIRNFNLIASEIEQQLSLSSTNEAIFETTQESLLYCQTETIMLNYLLNNNNTVLKF